MNKILICMMGLPRSGKSTVAKEISAEWGAPIVEPDAIRKALHGQPFISSAEPTVWATAKLMVKSLFISGHHTVILDSTSFCKARRDEWQSDDWGTEFFEITTPREVCVERARAQAPETEPEALIDCINYMAANYDELESDEVRSL